MKRTFYLVFVIITFVIFSIATALAQPSQLTKAVNFRHNYIPIEIQNGFVLDSVAYTPPVSQSVHFKYNSSGRLIWEDDFGVLTLQTFDSSRHRITAYYQLFSDNSYNEKGLLSLQSVHYYTDSVLHNYSSTIYSYNGDNRIQSIVYTSSNGGTFDSISFRYNSSGNLTGYYSDWPGMNMHSQSIVEYDSLGRIKSRLDSQDEDPNEYFYKYDSIGNATCTLVDSMSQGSPPIDTMQIHQFVYDGSRRELHDTWGWGTGDTSSYTKVVSTYDSSGKILSKVDSFYNKGIWSSGSPYDFAYNSDKNLNSCVAGSNDGSCFRPDGILLYDHYGNAFLAWFDYNHHWTGIYPYYSNLSTLGVTKSKGTPGDFYISQNYPNPFNPTTTINYSVPTRTFVSLKVFDILGREVTTLVNEEKSAGNYSVNFNGANLSSGVYFYSISAGNFKQVKKLIMLK